MMTTASGIKPDGKSLSSRKLMRQSLVCDQTKTSYLRMLLRPFYKVNFMKINQNKYTMHYNDNLINNYSYHVVPKSTVSKELNYLKKEDYGKVPEYLTKVREEIQRENDMIDRYVEKQMGEADKEPEELEEMSDFERQDLILALKDKWDAVNARYQKITHLVQLDNNCQIRRKEQLEAELRTLETDIKYLSQPGALLVKH